MAAAAKGEDIVSIVKILAQERALTPDEEKQLDELMREREATKETRPKRSLFELRGLEEPPGCATIKEGNNEEPAMTMYEVLQQAKALEPCERKELLSHLTALVEIDEGTRPKVTLMDLRGIMKGTWEGVDIDEYVREMRGKSSETRLAPLQATVLDCDGHEAAFGSRRSWQEQVQLQ